MAQGTFLIPGAFTFRLQFNGQSQGAPRAERARVQHRRPNHRGLPGLKKKPIRGGAEHPAMRLVTVATSKKKNVKI